ncbi:MAG: isochorismate synthase [Elainella sp. C42_A2020_010]|nr:isochorismate synthase [Elainella sp. C42_A2020_010]RNJ71090.1 MAG: isochorismate synthase [Leptolyngbya sp. IPPAS B-1204]
MLCQSPFSRLDSSQDCKKLYQFLDFCQQQSIADSQPKIASISLEIPLIDPLLVLSKLAKQNQPHFYFENRDKHQAIAAFDTAILQQMSGANRFSEAQQFIQGCFQRLLSNYPDIYAVQPPWNTPCFFSSFTFFDHNRTVDSPFPPATVFLPRWQIVRWQEASFVIVNWEIDTASRIGELTQTIWNQLQKLQLIQYDGFYLAEDQKARLNRWEIIETHDFQSTVSSALQSIHQQAYKKLVLAHAIDVCSNLPFQWSRSLHHLRQLHPDCCVFSTGNGNGQRFIGASPERLLSIRNRKLITDALAGSASRGRTAVEDVDFANRLFNSEKERREHQLVVEFIAQQLTALGLHPRYAEVPALLRLSNIQHLHTPIQAVLPAHLHPLQLLTALHPTPAVAGMPRQTACEQILHYEQFDRSLYAAPLGWVDAHGNAEFIVGIRSALLDGNRARLYAGAGIVAGSDPERELAEVKLKLQALLRGLI